MNGSRPHHHHGHHRHGGGAPPGSGEASSSSDAPSTGETKFLDPATLRFFPHAGRLRLTVGDQRTCLLARVVRLFPLSDAGHWFSLRDGGDREIGLLRDLSGLDADSRRAVDEDLRRRYFAPVIRKIVLARERLGVVEWDVETDRGRRKFSTRDLREQAVRPWPGRVILPDLDGNRWDVPDITALDAPSQVFLQRFA